MLGGHIPACLTANEVSTGCQKWQEMTGCARHAIITILTPPRVSRNISMHLSLKHSELHISAGSWAPCGGAASITGAVMRDAFVTHHYKVVIYCNFSQCHNSTDAHFECCHVSLRPQAHASTAEGTPCIHTLITGLSPADRSHAERHRCQLTVGDQQGHHHMSTARTKTVSGVHPGFFWRVRGLPGIVQWVTLWMGRGTESHSSSHVCAHIISAIIQHVPPPPLTAHTHIQSASPSACQRSLLIMVETGSSSKSSTYPEQQSSIIQHSQWEETFTEWG